MATVEATLERVQSTQMPAYPDRFHYAAAYAGISGDGTFGAGPAMTEETRLLLYALYQQATVGPCGDSKPWGWNTVERAKWESWKNLGRLPSVEAMRLFVRTLEEEQPDWWTKSLEASLQPGAASEEGSKAGTRSEAESTAHADGSLIGLGTGAMASAGGDGTGTGSEGKLPEVLAAMRTHDTWIAPFVVGRRPSPRYQHAAVAVGSKMYIIGGNSGGRYLSDIHVLDLSSLAWSRAEVTQAQPPSAADDDEKPPPPPPAPFPPCAGHKLVAWGTSLLLVGGYHKDSSKTVTVRLLDTVSSFWSTLDVGGVQPSTRGGHSVARVGNKVILFGGETRERKLMNDVHILDLATLEWSTPTCTGKIPPPRCDHVATMLSERHMLVFGGGSHSACYNDLYQFDVETFEWSIPETTGTPPSPRAGHAGATIGDLWYIVGGGNNAMGLTDTLSLDLLTMTWRPAATTPPRTAIASEGLTVVSVVAEEGVLVAFGGYNGKYSNDVHLFKPSPVSRSALAEERAETPRNAETESEEVPSAVDGDIVAAAKAAAEAATAAAEIAMAAARDNYAEDDKPLPVSGDSSFLSTAVAERDIMISGLQEQVQRLEAEAAREAGAAEEARRSAAGLRQELQDTRALTAKAEEEAAGLRAALADEQGKVFKLEVEVAELKQKLANMEVLEKEVQLLQRKAATAAAEAETDGKGSGTLWSWIAGTPATPTTSNGDAI